MCVYDLFSKTGFNFIFSIHWFVFIWMLHSIRIGCDGLDTNGGWYLHVITHQLMNAKRISIPGKEMKKIRQRKIVILFFFCWCYQNVLIFLLIFFFCCCCSYLFVRQRWTADIMLLIKHELGFGRQNILFTLAKICPYWFCNMTSDGIGIEIINY